MEPMLLPLPSRLHPGTYLDAFSNQNSQVVFVQKAPRDEDGNTTGQHPR